MLSKLNCFFLTFQEDVEVKESTTSQEDEESEDEGLEEVQNVVFNSVHAHTQV